MQFSQYLKKCRERNLLTQEQLVQELYNFDAAFHGLDTVTLSRWERGVSKPPLSKQTIIVKLFQRYTQSTFPCFDDIAKEEIERSICKVGIANLLGKSKNLITNFLANSIQADDMEILHVRHVDNIDQILQMPHALDKELTNNFSLLEQEHLKEWALHPSNLFLISSYKGQFFGMLFTLRLKPDTFERLLSFEMQEEELSSDDFASFEEMGCNYILSFFASNEQSASLLFLRYYSHIIANQEAIEQVGALTILDEGRKLIERLHLQKYEELHVKEGLLSSHRAPLSDVLINTDVMKMIFQKQECPEE